MIGQTISHYPDTNRRDATKRGKILEKLLNAALLHGSQDWGIQGPRP